jgi:lipooligosaccharide transport system permease protein
MVFTAEMSHIEMFNLPIFLLISPMFLFGGTFFPLEALPPWAAKIAWAFPLTHLVELTRWCALGSLDAGLIWNFLYLVAFSCLFFPLAIWRMKRRLIK